MCSDLLPFQTAAKVGVSEVSVESEEHSLHLALNVFDGKGAARDPAGEQLSATVGDLKVVADFLG